MKKVAAFLLLVIFMTGCSPKPEMIDTGSPGLIMVVTFVDENRNGTYEKNEPTISDRVGISQDVSCPAGNMETVSEAETNLDGEAVFDDLKPGTYCVMYLGSKASTTKLTSEINLSSEQQFRVEFGLLE